MPCAMPKSGAMTSARQVAPFRNADGPSRLTIRLDDTQQGVESGLRDSPDTDGRSTEGSSSPYAVEDPSVAVLTLALLQGLQTSLYD